ncbi:MAG: hypothetical protein H8D78_17815 [Chloroflexi bacterium]|nr:hypothetical protein [Chloroflexota bacterium]
MSLQMVKSVLTTVLLLVAIAQALSMAMVRGWVKVKLLPENRRRLREGHRWGGIAALVLTLALALTMLSPLYEPYSARSWAHAVMGGLAALVLLPKVIITRRFRRYLRYNTALGTIAGLLILGTFISSALWFFVDVA